MNEENVLLIQQEIRSPRSAAIAGILFAVLLTISTVLMYPISSTDPLEINQVWLESKAGTANLAIFLVPYAGIAFIWFTGVIRERLGAFEDRFFATIFFGTGLLIVAMLFIWAATIGAVFGSFAVAPDVLRDTDIVIFGFALMNRIIGVFGLRMAGAYMFSIGTLWTRSGTMPRWLTIVTYVVALGFLLFASWLREARFVFLGWVFLVSAYVLITNYRGSIVETGDV